MSEPVKFGPDCPLPIAPVSRGTMEVNQTGSWRYLQPRYRHRISPCRAGCPAAMPVERVLALVQDGHIEQAAREILLENPFPGLCGRVCYHPCETVCNRRQLDSAVAIQLIERFVADRIADDTDKLSLLPDRKKHTGRSVAVVGSGPAGLAAAYFLALLGHSVTVFEAEQELGGIPRHAIPSYRLPRSVLDLEIERILSLDIEVHTGTRVGADKDWPELGGFDARFLATGLGRPRILGIAGETAEKVQTGLGFLKRFNSGGAKTVGERLVVIGGGNTAIDVARTALRAGCRNVTLIAVESPREMPALAAEVDEAAREGIAMQFRMAPAAVIVDDDNQVVAVQLVRARLGKPDACGQREIVIEPGTERIVETDNLIIAIGEERDPSALPGEGDYLKDIGLGRISDAGSGPTLVGGDLATEPHAVVTAIASGKRAAMAIDAELGKSRPDWEELRVADGGVSFARYLGRREQGQNQVIDFDGLNMDYFRRKERARTPRLSVPERVDNFREVNRGLKAKAARAEAARCFHCGVCTACDNCFIFCPDIAVSKDPGGGYDIRYEYCKGCGICVHECPRGAMQMFNEEE